jgi:signal transduction histidine kinase
MKVKSIKPDIRKVFLVNLFKIFGAAILIVLVLVLLHFTAGLDMFIEIFATFGLEIIAAEALVWFIIAIIVLSIVVLFVNYLVLLNVKYEFYEDKMVIYKNSMLIFTNSTDIPYRQISKVTFNADGFLNTLFNTGSVYLDLSTMGLPVMELEFIDRVAESARYIQDVIRAHLAKVQAEYTEKYKIDGILDKGKFI